MDLSGPRRRGEEVATAVPAGILLSDEPEVGLVNERGGLERVAGRGLGHQRPAESAQFGVDGREQPVRCHGVPGLHGLEDPGHHALP
jgi:hypothetical protein